MTSQPKHRTSATRHRIGFGIVAILAMLLVFLSFVSLIDTYAWWVRVTDFPRLQMIIALGVLAIPAIWYLGRFRRASAGLLVLMAAAIGYNAVILTPYVPAGGAVSVDVCPAGHEVSILVANVQVANDPEGELIEIVRRQSPDVFLALETDPTWDRALKPLGDWLPHTVSQVSKSAFSIHLFSRLPLVAPEIRFLAGQETPQVITGLRLESGKVLTLLGIHPRPPNPGESALGRDAVLYEAALIAAESDRPTLVAGDFNAVPWEAAVERMRSIGLLEDPRRSYGYIPTFDAKSWWMSWPLDQILHQPGFALLSLERLPYFGSDHYPILGRFCWFGEPVGAPPPEPEQEEVHRARKTIEKARAE